MAIGMFESLFGPVASIFTGRATGDGEGGGGDTTDVGEFREEAGIEELEAPTIDFETIMEGISRVTQQNIEMAPEISETAAGLALERARQFDPVMSERFFSNLRAILPDFEETIIGTSRDILGQVAEGTRSLLAGEIPEDVRAQIQRSAAEQGIQQGLFGQARDFATARDLGLTSLELQGRGVQQAVGAVQPLTTGLLNQALTLQPPVTDIPSMFANEAARIAPGAQVSPTAALQAGTQIGVANAQAAWAAQLSDMNLALDLYQTQAQREMNQAAIRSQQQLAQLQLFGDILGSAGAIATGGLA